MKKYYTPITQQAGFKTLFLVSCFLFCGCLNEIDLDAEYQDRTYNIQFIDGTSNKPVLVGKEGRASLSASNFLEFESIDLGYFEIDENGFASVAKPSNNSCVTCQLRVNINGRVYKPLSHSSSGVYQYYRSDSGTLVINNWLKGLKASDTLFYAVKTPEQDHPMFFKQAAPFAELVNTLRIAIGKDLQVYYALNNSLEDRYNHPAGKFTIDKSLYTQVDLRILDDPQITKLRIMD